MQVATRNHTRALAAVSFALSRASLLRALERVDLRTAGACVVIATVVIAIALVRFARPSEGGSAPPTTWWWR
ncbi:MAG TPA: hypothetical protein VIQ24_21965 [Pyrinomonadaceae bacterium]